MTSFGVFTPDDFPLISIGYHVYARQWTMPILTAANPHLAALVTDMLNAKAEVEAPLSTDKQWFPRQ